MTDATLTTVDPLSEVRAYLATLDVVRLPNVSGSEAVCWIEPRDGVKAPGEGGATERSDVVVGMFRSGEIARAPMEYQLRTITIEFIVRSRLARDVWPLDVALFDAMHDRYQTMMGDVMCIHSRQFRGMQRLGSDAHGYTFSTEYALDVWSGAPHA